MSEKRKRDGEDNAAGHAGDKKRQRKGFSVGPANLPDGLYKRKTQKIKQGLIDKAKIKKEYAKLKKQGKVPEEEDSIPVPASQQVHEGAEHEEEQDEPTNEPHPDRQVMIEKGPEEAEQPPRERRPRGRKPRVAPFKKEHEAALKRRAEAEERRRAREEAERQRQEKMQERERFRKAMAKARTGGPNGQRKLGRESTVLLEKVQRMVKDGL